MLKPKLNIKYYILFFILIYIFVYYNYSFFCSNSKIDINNIENNILRFENTLNKHQKRIFYNILENIKEIEFQKANIDDLSGLYNRRGFNKIFENNVKRYKNKLVNNIGLIMFDMNYLKNINDHYGHNTGDKILKNISYIFKNIEKKYINTNIKIYSSRYGGDEFYILVSFLEKNNIKQMDLLINNIIKDINMELYKNNVIKNIIYKISNKCNISPNDVFLLSVGYTFSVTIKNNNIIEIMKEEADKKMYENKNEIKNNVLMKNKNISCFR